MSLAKALMSQAAPYRQRCPQAIASGHSLQASLARGKLTVACASKGQEELEHKARRMLQEDPETASRLQAVDEAAAVVARIQAERAKVDRLLSNSQASSRNNLSEDELAARETLIREVNDALRDMASAKEELENARREKFSIEQILDRDKDRIESAKAGAIAGLAGVLGALPIQLASDTDPVVVLLASAPILLSAALFGIVLRYAVRDDWGDFQLKQGVILAFAFARGLGAVDFAHMQLSTNDILDTAYRSAFAVGTSAVAFACAGLAVQAAVVGGQLAPCKRTRS